jgi:cell division protein ZapD
MTLSNQNNAPQKTILFEYPLQESVRSYLRLESLFKQFQRNLLATDKDNHFHALKFLFEILEILERGDTRAELIKELSRLTEYFHQLEANPDVDTSKLSSFLIKIQQLHQWTHSYQGKFGESIRKHPFIESVKHRTSIPGGSCSFDCPELYLFLNKAHEIRQKELKSWIADVKGVETSVDVILRLIRDHGQWQTENAPLGSFILETSEQPLKLLRIRSMDHANTFPEFSCGKHRSSIHFMTFNAQHKKIPINAKIKFELARCN